MIKNKLKIGQKKFRNESKIGQKKLQFRKCNADSINLSALTAVASVQISQVVADAESADIDPGQNHRGSG